jgi:hypothetical protein
MTTIAVLVMIMYIKTGNATGSDKEWVRIAKNNDINFKIVGFKEQNLDSNAIIITNEELETALPHLIEANKQLQRHIPVTNLYNRRLLLRNWFIIKDTQMTLAFAPLKYDETVDGGTGWGVEFTKELQNDLFVLNTNNHKWYKYNYSSNKFEIQDPTYLCEKTACIGSRNITDTDRIYMRIPFMRHFGGLYKYDK